MSPAAEPDENGIQWISVTSSHIARIAYDANEAAVLVEFSNGDMWSYPAHQDEWEGLLNAESKGRYVRLMFRGRGSRIS